MLLACRDLHSPAAMTVALLLRNQCAGHPDHRSDKDEERR